MNRNLTLDGLEDAVLDLIASEFVFVGQGVKKDLALTKGTHLFNQDMAENEGIAKTTAGFNDKKEPVVSIYNVGGVPHRSSPSSDSKLDSSLRVVIRFGTVFDAAKVLLEQLNKWLAATLPGRRAGGFKIKGVFIVNRPTPFQRAGDDQAYCTSTLRFLAVPIV